MTTDISKYLPPLFGNLPPLTEAQKEERRTIEAKLFEKQNYQDACKNLASKL